ncbi:6-phosphogluconolactonase [Acrocarpospora phusangensis]|uniref:6-phosphogluconolactonase n=1 Tax=Acrocarpospora phusangensis TaxID=1070424 RepID=A0A919QC64_9ACTN|nr:6-phosphogluconolactonase [Acrocarpospora phusangensis]GIH24675.1 6-phosphogluconolactonase [Acrocarpospora phusangensis]
MSVPSVLVHNNAAVLAEAVAARLITRLVDVQAARGSAHVVLTGGTVGIATLAAVAATPARDAIDWRALDLWWGDERFLPAGDPERNETQAREALLDRVELTPSRVHAMAPAGAGLTAEEAAEAYAAELAKAANPEDHGPVPSFDVLMLGMGPDSHVASLFPGHPALYEEERSVVAVHNSPKPPPTRVSLTFPAIQAAREVWVVAAGAEKAQAVHLALTAGRLQAPAAGARGRQRTLFLLDRAAAAQIPPGLGRIASP